LKTSADSRYVEEKEHDFLLGALGGSSFDAKSDRLLELQHQAYPGVRTHGLSVFSNS
jgi:hypothetical protein